LKADIYGVQSKAVNNLRVLLLVLIVPFASLASAQNASTSSKVQCRSGQYHFKGTVVRGESFSRKFDGFVFALLPTEYGWDIDIAQGEQHHLEGLTGPMHFVPRTVEIEGWHFRNAANTGPNTGDVNAPDETREFMFSPRWPHCENAEGLDKDGKGALEITDMELGNLVEGEKAFMTKMEFSVVLTVRRSACTPCPIPNR
jgi:hypothetical protein